MRFLLLTLLLAACGDDAANVKGTVTVSVYTDGQAGSELPVPPMPISGLRVFEEGGAVATTDGDGNAVVSITHDPATIHITGPKNATTVFDVPVGGVVRLGRSVYSPSVGVLSVQFDDIGATSYSVGAGCLSIGPAHATPQFTGTMRGTCVGHTVTVIGLAATGVGTKVAQKDVAIQPNTTVMVPGYVDASSYSITLTNAPPLGVEPVAKIGVVGPSGDVTILPGLDGPSSIDMVKLVADSGTGTSSVDLLTPLTPGNNVVDASHLIPFATVTDASLKHVAWDFEPAASQPNLVKVSLRSTQFSWTIYGPPTLRSATFPEYPDDSAPPADAAVSGVLGYYELSRPALTLAELNPAWGATADDRAIASSNRTF